MDKYVRQAHGANRGAGCAVCKKVQNGKELQKYI